MKIPLIKWKTPNGVVLDSNSKPKIICRMQLRPASWKPQTKIISSDIQLYRSSYNIFISKDMPHIWVKIYKNDAIFTLNLSIINPTIT